MTIKENLSSIHQRIESTDSNGIVRLLAVSKTFGVEAIAEAIEAGERCFGENYVQEGVQKIRHFTETLPMTKLEWHFIGPLQSNKVRKVVQTCQMIHSIDTPELLERIDRIAGEEGRHPQILLEVSVSGEKCKGGVSLEKLHELCLLAVQCRNVDFQGFMTMAPLDADEAYTAALFEMLALRRDEESRLLNKALPVLSMGMSGDFETAVRHGSTLVRVGTAIFGVR